MKRLIPAAVLVLFIIIICIISSKTVINSVNAANESLRNCERLFSTGSLKEATAAANDFKENWKTQSKLISLFSNHCSLDDINLLAASLPDSVAAGKAYEFNASVSKIKLTLDMIYNEHSFTVDSLY